MIIKMKEPVEIAHLLQPGQKIEFSSYYDCPDVLKYAKEIAASVNPNGRSHAQMIKDASNGLALQFAVRDHLASKGINVKDSENKLYDLDIDGDLCVDVKGIFKPDAKTYSQTTWEAEASSRFERPIFYMCFDCRDGTATYDGWCKRDDFRPSKFNNGGFYIFSSKLNR